MVRCYIGIFLPNSLKPRVVELQNMIKTLDLDCKLVETENLHLTLSFLGKVDDSEIQSIKGKLDGISGCFQRFNISIGEVKLIPSKKYVRVIALVITDSLGMLSKISSGIKRTIGGDVKPPHLTLCRVRKVGKFSELDKLLNVDSSCDEMEVSSIQLIESKLSRSGPVYSILHESFLRD